MRRVEEVRRGVEAEQGIGQYIVLCSGRGFEGALQILGIRAARSCPQLKSIYTQKYTHLSKSRNIKGQDKVLLSP